MVSRAPKPKPGSAVRRQVDVRIVASTNRDLRALVRAGRFREDLFFRLSAFELMLPALAEREEDLPVLIRHFVDQLNQRTTKKIVGLTPSAERVLLEYAWPGNVRELEQAVQYAAVMSFSMDWCWRSSCPSEDLPR